MFRGGAVPFTALSPSSRRAWIEMVYRYSVLGFLAVALLTEGVDRNSLVALRIWSARSRPPHGGRG